MNFRSIDVAAFTRLAAASLLVFGSSVGAQTLSSSDSAPTENILLNHEPPTSPASIYISRTNETGTGAFENAVGGQTFKNVLPSEISAVKLRLAADYTSAASPGTQVLQLAFAEDTDGDGKGDVQVGSTYEFDFSGHSFTTGDYITFTLDTPVTLSAGVNHFEAWWTSNGTNRAIQVERAANDGTYADGGLFQLSPNPEPYNFPVLADGDIVSSSAPNRDLTFYIQGSSTWEQGTLATSTTPPSSGQILGYVPPSTGQQTITRKEDDSPAAFQSRVSGQTFRTVAPALMDSVTLQLNAAADFSGAAPGEQLLTLAVSEDTTETGLGDSPIGDIHFFDVAGLNLAADDYLTFQLPQALSLPATSTIQVEFWWSAADDKNEILIKRAANNGTYAGGGLVAIAPNSTLAFPVLEAGTLTDNRDLVFYIGGTELWESGAVASSTSAPATDILIQSVPPSTAAQLMTRLNDDSPSAFESRVIGQTFQPPFDASLDSLTVQLNADFSSGLAPDSGINVLTLAFSEDTNENGLGNSQVGNIFTYDVGGASFNASDYITFDFPTPVSVTGGTTYQFEFWWASARSGGSAHRLDFNRAANNGDYAGGGLVELAPNTNLLFPILEAGGPAIDDRDLVFFLEGTESVGGGRLDIVAAPGDGTGLAFPLTTVGGSETGSIELTNTGDQILNITDISLANTDTFIDYTTSAPTTPIALNVGESTTLDFTYAPTAEGRHEATLTVTSDSVTGSPVDIRLLGRVVLQGSIFESFVVDSNATLATSSSGQETPSRANDPANGGSGFTWGAYTNATGSGFRGNVTLNAAAGRLTFFGNLADDATASANFNSSYAYTLFDTTGGTAPDRIIDLDKIQIFASPVAAGQEVRFLVRDANDQWFLSQDVFSVPQPTAQDAQLTVDVDVDFSGWLRVNSAAETNMNELDAGAQVAISSPTGLSPAFPDLTGVSGGGIYIETGDTDATVEDTFGVNDINFLARPSDNDVLTVAVADSTTNNVATVPNRRLGLAALKAEITTGIEVVLDGLDVTVSGSGVTDSDIREVVLYTDTVGNGLPQDGAALAEVLTGTVSGGVATITLEEPRTFVVGSIQDLTLGVIFEESAVGKTFTFTVTESDWAVSPEGGQGDTVAHSPSGDLSVNVTVNAVNFPTAGTEDTTTVFASETWEGVSDMAFPETAPTGGVSGDIPGGDLAWTYSLINEASFAYGAGVKEVDGSQAVGRETRDAGSEPQPFKNYYITHELDPDLMFGPEVKILTVKFDAIVLETYDEDDTPFSTGVIGGRGNFRLNLNGATESYSNTFQPLTTATRLFTAFAGEAVPFNITDIDDSDGVGRYAITVSYAPYGDDEHTYVQFNVENLDTAQTASMTTIQDGFVPTVESLQFVFNGWSNVFVDDIEVSVTGAAPVSVEDWMMY